MFLIVLGAPEKVFTRSWKGQAWPSKPSEQWYTTGQTEETFLKHASLL